MKNLTSSLTVLGIISSALLLGGGAANADSISSSGASSDPSTTSAAVSSPNVFTRSGAGVNGSGNSGSAATIYNLTPNNGSSLTVAPTFVYAPSWTKVEAPRPVFCPAVVDIQQALATNLWLPAECHPAFVQSPPPVTTQVTPPPAAPAPPAQQPPAQQPPAVPGTPVKPNHPESPLY